MLIAHNIDPIWDIPSEYITRRTARAIAIDNGKLVYLKVEGKDEFGIRNHYESIGGGVEENEDLYTALHREVQEEIGAECKIIKEVGTIIDYYNLINTKTISTYFLVVITNYNHNLNYTEEEKALVQGCEYHSIEEMLKLLDYNDILTVNDLVHRRELTALKYCIDT